MTGDVVHKEGIQPHLCSTLTVQALFPHSQGYVAPVYIAGV